MDTHEENGGTACSGLSTEQQNCNTGTCPAGNDYHCAIDAKPKINMNRRNYRMIIHLVDANFFCNTEIFIILSSELCMGYMGFMGYMQ